MRTHVHARTRTAITAGILGLSALGLVGCGARPDPVSAPAAPVVTSTSVSTPTPTPTWSPDPVAQQNFDDLTTLMDYSDTADDVQALFQKTQKAARIDDLSDANATIIALGDDYTRIAKKGFDLPDIPNASEWDNDEWDIAMADMQTIGRYLQAGLSGSIVEPLQSAVGHMNTANAAVAAAFDTYYDA